MKDQYILPQQCRKCGAMFDLYYELLEERTSSEDMQEKLGQDLAESLCWNCKQKIIHSMEDPENSEEDINDFFIELELE